MGKGRKLGGVTARGGVKAETEVVTEPRHPEDSTAKRAGTSDERGQSQWGEGLRPTPCRDRDLPYRGAV